MDKILIIDGLNYFYRGVFSFGKKDETKEDFGIVFNFFRNFRATVEQFKPNKIFICLEGKDCFRYNLYSEYKANRIIKTGSKKEATKTDFFRQISIILELIKYLPVIQLKAEKYEADDCVNTLCENLKDEEIVVVSGDSDLIQLLQKGYKNIQLYNATKKEFIVAPEYHYVVYKSLNGDTSDNIHKLENENVAIQLVLNPKNLNDYVNNPEKTANYKLNLDLVRLRIVPEDELLFTEYNVNFDKLKEEFVKKEFKSLLTDKYWNKFVETFKEIK